MEPEKDFLLRLTPEEFDWLARTVATAERQQESEGRRLKDSRLLQRAKTGRGVYAKVRMSRALAEGRRP